MSHRWLDDLRPDLRYATRQLRRTPGFTALVVLTLALGIGANVTMAGAIDRLLFRAPAGIRDPDRVVRLLFVSDSPRGESPAFVPRVGSGFSYPAFLDLQRDVSSFESIAGYSASVLSLGVGAEAVPVRASLVSPSFFTLLGVTPAVGRVFGANDGFSAGETSDGPRLALLGYGFWQRQFAGDRGVVGRAVRIGSLTYEIVGVTPSGFRGAGVEEPDVWLPIAVTTEAESPQLWLLGRNGAWVSVVARLRPGASRAAAEQQATIVARHERGSDAGAATSQFHITAASIIRGRSPDIPRDVKIALWLAGVSVLVLLIACANIANLLLARAWTRRREVAVRLVLGASRERLARQLLADALLLAGLGGVVALWVAALGGRVLQRVLPMDTGPTGLVDARLFAFTAAIALGTGVLIGLAPLFQATALDLTEALRATAAGGRHSRVRTLLLGTQAALCVLLLVGAGLFAQSLRRVEGLDLGLDVSHTLVARFNFNDLALPRPDIDAAYDEMVRGVRAVPGVTGAVLAAGNPYLGGSAVAVHTPAHAYDFYYHGTYLPPMSSAVGNAFFRAVGASLRGRDFDTGDRPDGSLVAIINEPLALRLFPGEDALGQCILLPVRAYDEGGPCVTVVGVVHGFFYQTILNRDRPLVYVPLTQWAQHRGLGRPRGLFVSSRGDPAVVAPAVRRVIQGLLPDLPAVRIDLMKDVVDPEMRPWRLAATMFSIFGAVALVIAVVGVYGVVAFSAAQRSAEIAIRIALGARPRHVLRVIGGQGMLTVVAGLGVGVSGALALRHWIGPLLFQTSASDPRIIAGVAVLLIGVALLATLVPTARAIRRGPAAILRE
jgi:predicted permease